MINLYKNKYENPIQNAWNHRNNIAYEFQYADYVRFKKNSN